MSISIGIVAALIALLAWGFGDFFIQRSIRAIGALGALFFIGIFGAVLLLPFAWSQLPTLFEHPTLLLLLVTLAITFVGAVVLFQALKVGKLSVVEPILSTELIITLIISVLFLHEAVNSRQLILIILIFIGIAMVAIHRQHKIWWQWWKQERRIEKGVMLAVVGALLSALINTFTALASRDVSPIGTIWFVHTGLAIICIFVMGFQGKIQNTFRSARAHWKPVLLQSILDNVAWVAYAVAVLTIPISVAVAISESYIVLTALLGITLGKEKLLAHQYAGIAVTVIAATVLALISG